MASLRRGLTLIEIVIVVACALGIIVGVIVLASNRGAGPRVIASRIKDGTQVSQVHKSFLIYSQEKNGELPLPGRIKCLPVDPAGDVAVPGAVPPMIGPEDVSQNTTANLFSSMIAQNFYTPELLVSPAERNPNVFVDVNYDYGAYQPAFNSYWDSNFVADLVDGSNASYAHQPLTLERRHLWQNSLDSLIAQVGNRGPVSGSCNSSMYTCDASGMWTGHVVFADNHVEVFASPTPTSVSGDNLFLEEEREKDALLAFTKAISEKSLELQFD